MKYNNVVIKGTPKFEAYPDSRNDGELTSNKVLVPNGSGGMLLKTLPASIPSYSIPITKATSFQIEAIQNNKYILCTSAIAMIVTVPLEATESLAVGFKVDVIQRGVGEVSIVGEGAVVIKIDVDEQLKISSQNNAITITKIGADKWAVYGALASV